MEHRKLIVSVVLAGAGLAALAGSMGWSQPGKDTKPAAAPKAPTTPAAPPEMPLPPGWTAEDMQACIEAGTPGEKHSWLLKSVGVWNGKCQMWMAPGTPPMASECTNTVTGAMDGRYVKAEMAGEMPGMGPFSGFGITGFDNVSKKFVASWIDNHSSGIMQGTGELSADSKTLTWSFSYNDPVTKKPGVVRQIETYPDANSSTFAMFVTDPKSGKEYKCMHIEFTRKK